MLEVPGQPELRNKVKAKCRYMARDVPVETLVYGGRKDSNSSKKHFSALSYLKRNGWLIQKYLKLKTRTFLQRLLSFFFFFFFSLVKNQVWFG